MKNDEELIAEAYTRIYHESDSDFVSDDLRAGALDHEDIEKSQAEVNQDELKKYTYEILYKTDYKYDPKTKKPISYSFKSHSSGRPDLRHVFARSEDEFWSKMDKSLRGTFGNELKDHIVLKATEPADPEEVKREEQHAQTMHDYYHGPGSENRYFGD
jgi:hypothetical protein